MACGFCILFFAICRISCKNSRYFFNAPQKNPQPISILWKRAVDFSFNTTPPRCSLASAGGISHQTSEQLNHRIGSFRLQIIRQKLLNFSHIFRNHCLVAANDFIKSKAKRERPTPFPFGFFAVHSATDGFTVSIPTTQMSLPSSSRLSICTIAPFSEMSTGRKIHSPSPFLESGCGFFAQYCAASALLSCNCSLSAIRAINSLFVGFPLVLLTV